MTSEKTVTSNQVNESGASRDQRRVMRPAVDVFENGESLTLLANLPGVEEDGLALEVDSNQLTRFRHIHEPINPLLADSTAQFALHRFRLSAQGTRKVLTVQLLERASDDCDRCIGKRHFAQLNRVCAQI